jgi:hypothetical protein
VTERSIERKKAIECEKERLREIIFAGFLVRGCAVENKICFEIPQNDDYNGTT